MNKFIALCIAALTLLFAGGCANDINTNADYKEIMIVYGLLNPNDSVHYVRVNKAFLTNGQSAYEVAKTNDTAYFNSLEVKIDEYDISLTTPIYKATYILQQDKTTTKDTGIFANYPNILFSFVQKLNPNFLYRLTVTNKKTGLIARSETVLVHNPTLGSPSQATNSYLIDPTRNIVLAWTGGKNSKIHDLVLRFYWDEYDSATNQIVNANQYLDWNLVQNKENPISGQIRNNVPGGNFYDFVGAKLPYIVGKYRIPTKFDFMFWAADEQFEIYRTANSPGTGIVQTKPEYTNISNGNFGLFASRNSYVIEGVTLSDRTVTFLRTNESTKHLKFREP